MLNLTRTHVESIFSEDNVRMNGATRLVFNLLIERAFPRKRLLGKGVLGDFAKKIAAQFTSATKINAIKYARDNVHGEVNAPLLEAVKAAGYDMTDGPAKGEYAGSTKRVEYLSLAGAKQFVEDIFAGKRF